MKKILNPIYQIILYLSLFEFFLINKSSHAFFPIINLPNQQELKSKSIQIGKSAVQLIRFGEYEEATKLLKLAIKLNPKEVDLWINLADSQIRSEKHYEALSSLNEAIKLKPNDESIYFGKASIYVDLNDPLKARFAIEKGLSLNKNNEWGYFLLGNAELMLNNYNEALIAFKESAKINTNFWQSINNEGLILYELNNLKEAKTKFQLALEISNNAEPMLALAIILFSSDKNSIEALRLAKNALKSNHEYISEDYQTKQLWGQKLQQGAKRLFKAKEMKKAVIEAKGKSQ